MKSPHERLYDTVFALADEQGGIEVVNALMAWYASCPFTTDKDCVEYVSGVREALRAVKETQLNGTKE